MIAEKNEFKVNNLAVIKSPFEITTFAEAERLAKLISESDFAPKDYKGKPGNVLIAMQHGFEIGLKPMQAIQNIAVVNGRPMVYGDAALALVIAKPECGSVDEYIDGSIEKNNAVAHCNVRRGNNVIHGEFSIAQAKKAGLWGKAGPWSQYPERMLQLRARGFALRDSFPDVLKGVYIEGEILPDDSKEVANQRIDAMINSKVENTKEFREINKIIRNAEKLSDLDVVPDMVKTMTDVNNEVQTIRQLYKLKRDKLKEKESVNQETGEVINIVDVPESDIAEQSSEFEKIKKQIEKAKSIDTLDIAGDLIRSLKDEDEIEVLHILYSEKRATMKG